MSRILEAFAELPDDVAVGLARDLASLPWNGPPGTTTLIDIGECVLANYVRRPGIRAHEPEHLLGVHAALGDACRAAEELNPDVEPWGTIRSVILDDYHDPRECFFCNLVPAAA